MAVDRRDLRIAALALAGLAIVVVAGLWIAGRAWHVGPFECSGWSLERGALERGSPDERLDEAGTLAKCGELEGSTREEVLAALGQPDLPRAQLGSRREWAYFVAGVVPSYLKEENRAYLAVRFGEGERVVAVEPPSAAALD